MSDFVFIDDTTQDSWKMNKAGCSFCGFDVPDLDVHLKTDHPELRWRKVCQVCWHISDNTSQHLNHQHHFHGLKLWINKKKPCYWCQEVGMHSIGLCPIVEAKVADNLRMSKLYPKTLQQQRWRYCPDKCPPSIVQENLPPKVQEYLPPMGCNKGLYHATATTQPPVASQELWEQRGKADTRSKAGYLESSAEMAERTQARAHALVAEQKLWETETAKRTAMELDELCETSLSTIKEESGKQVTRSQASELKAAATPSYKEYDAQLPLKKRALAGDCEGVTEAFGGEPVWKRKC